MERLQYDGPFGPAAKVTAVHNYEWLTGGFFLVHRLEGRLGDHEMACIEIIGHDASSQTYPTHTFHNDGNTKVWQVRESGGTWTSPADWEYIELAKIPNIFDSNPRDPHGWHPCCLPVGLIGRSDRTRQFAEAEDRRYELSQLW